MGDRERDPEVEAIDAYMDEAAAEQLGETEDTGYQPTIGPGLTDSDLALARTAGLTFIEWKEDVPAQQRAELYQSLHLTMYMSQWAMGEGIIDEPLYDDSSVEFMGMAYIEDRDVFKDAGYAEAPDGHSSVMLTQQQLADQGRTDAWGEVLVGQGQSFKTFYDDLMSQGGPEGTFATDESLMNFIEGSGGWLGMDYAMRRDLTDFAPMALAMTGVGAFGSVSRLSLGLLGTSRSAQLAMTTARMAGIPVGTMFKWFNAMSTSTPYLVGSAGFLGAGILKYMDESNNAAITQELQRMAVEQHAAALAGGDPIEARMIADIAGQQGLDPSGDLLNTAARTSGPASGRKDYTEYQGRTASLGLPDPLEQRTQFGDYEQGVPQEIRARFDRRNGQVETIKEDYELGEPFAGDPTQSPDFAPLHGFDEYNQDYVRERWIVPLNAKERSFMEQNFNEDDFARIEAGQPLLRQPIFRNNDWHKYLSKLTPSELISVQNDMVVGNWMRMGLNGGPPRPGLIDEDTLVAMSNVMFVMNQEGLTSDPGHFLSTNAKGTLSRKNSQTQDLGGGGRAARAPFFKEAYIAPDYDTLSQTAKGRAREKLGRNLNAAEIQILADKMAEDDRAAFDVRQTARRLNYDAAGRGGEAGFAGETEDVQASFEEFFDNRYTNEIQRGQDVAQMYAKTRNLFSGLDNAARLVGR